MKRVTIQDIAGELGVSTATVSNVIHGKTKKISDRTVKKVQALLEKKQYVPNMAAILLAQNSSRIVCVVLSDHTKYEGRMIQDPFVSAMLDGISSRLQECGYFMMLQKAQDIDNIVKYASMWNMAGLILIGYCKQEYVQLRSRMRVPFVVVDGAFDKLDRFANITSDNFDGGYQMGQYLWSMGHRKIMFLSDNYACGDYNRYLGIKKAMEEHNHTILQEEDYKLLPVLLEERLRYYAELISELPAYTAAFCASDAYAIEWIYYLQDHGVAVPTDFSVAGFDDIPACTMIRPALTTINQNIAQKASEAVSLLNALIENQEKEKEIVLSPILVERNSIKKLI